MNEKTVLITGCSSGFGKLAAKTFHQRGWNVVATMRSPEHETELGLLQDVWVTHLDVTDPDSIQRTVAAGLARFGAIHALVNNAGYGGYAVFEQHSDTAVRAMYETNVFGLMNVTRAVLPIMRRQKEGRIVNVSSMAGFVGGPTFSVYASTKFAVEGLTESMAYEYKPLNILVRSVVPGAFPTTRFSANTANEVDAGDNELAAYGRVVYENVHEVIRRNASAGGSLSDPQAVADQIFDCVTKDTPVHNPVGADATLYAELTGYNKRQAFIDRMEAMMTHSK